MAPSSSGQGHRPLKAKTVGSNPTGATILKGQSMNKHGWMIILALCCFVLGHPALGTLFLFFYLLSD